MKDKNPFNKECNSFAQKFDEALDAQDWDATQRTIRDAESYISKHSGPQYTPIYYSIGTAYSDLAKNKSGCMNDTVREKTLYYFRTALDLLVSHNLKDPIFQPYVLGLQLPLLTNYANALSSIGRKTASIRYYREVLEISPEFSMAKGNIGVELLSYSRLFQDSGHQNYLRYFSYYYLKSAIKDSSDPIHPDAKQHFSNILAEFSQSYIDDFLEKPLEISEYSLGDSEERAYRIWCLHNHLFLNPLNDLPLEHSCFAADVLRLPDLTTEIHQTDIPIFYGIFNQLKQEYIYARYLCYKGSCILDSPHYADKDTCLIELSDFPQYSIRVENLKAAFRLLYSLLDKSAFFFNFYYNLGIKERDITFRSIWKHASKKYNHKSLQQAEDNIGIEAVRWMYKDFNSIFDDSVSPREERLNTLRNALEHKYVKVHNCLLYDVDSPYVDEEKTYHISETDLQTYTLDLMHMIRELIISISIAVHIHELQKLANCSAKKFFPCALSDYDDAWKI